MYMEISDKWGENVCPTDICLIPLVSLFMNVTVYVSVKLCQHTLTELCKYQLYNNKCIV